MAGDGTETAADADAAGLAGNGKNAFFFRAV